MLILQVYKLTIDLDHFGIICLTADFFFFLINFKFYSTKSAKRQSLKQAKWTTLGRLSLLKQKDLLEARENFAVTWAAELLSLLTQ